MNTRSVGKEFRNLLKITGETVWKRELQKFKSRYRCSDLDRYGQYLANKNPLLFAIGEYLELERSGKSIWKNMNERIMRVAGYAYLVNRISKNGGDKLRRKIIGRLLNDDDVNAQNS